MKVIKKWTPVPIAALVSNFGEKNKNVFDTFQVSLVLLYSEPQREFGSDSSRESDGESSSDPDSGSDRKLEDQANDDVYAAPTEMASLASLGEPMQDSEDEAAPTEMASLGEPMGISEDEAVNSEKAMKKDQENASRKRKAKHLKRHEKKKRRLAETIAVDGRTRTKASAPLSRKRVHEKSGKKKGKKRRRRRSWLYCRYLVWFFFGEYIIGGLSIRFFVLAWRYVTFLAYGGKIGEFVFASQRGNGVLFVSLYCVGTVAKKRNVSLPAREML